MLEAYAIVEPGSYEAAVSTKEGKYMFMEYGLVQFLDENGAPMDWNIVAIEPPAQMNKGDSYYEWTSMHGDSVISGPMLSRPQYIEVELGNVPGRHRIAIPQLDEPCQTITVKVSSLGRSIEFRLIDADSGQPVRKAYRLLIEGAGAHEQAFVIDADDTGRATAHGMPDSEAFSVTVFQGDLDDPQDPKTVQVKVSDNVALVPVPRG